MFLDDVLKGFKDNGNKIAYSNNSTSYTYLDLYVFICKVYELIKFEDKTRPIIVYGEKEVYMKASFLACAFLGIPYVPIDKSISDNRFNYIIEAAKSNIIIGDVDKRISNDAIKVISFQDIQSVNEYKDIQKINMQPNDTFYIIFTSGTTGNPKGVEVSYENLDSCVQWLKKLISVDSNNDLVIYNQAKYSFDLSVADLYLSLITFSNYYIGKKMNGVNYSDAFNDLLESKANLMVLTPSMLEMFLIDKSFNDKNIKALRYIFLCGERLTKKTVDKIYLRFPNIILINMYGPTECTYAVTSISIDDKMDEIPIGKPKEDVFIYIVDDNKNELSDEKIGEILIAGKSVAKGYINVNSDEKFFLYKGQRAYLTGDLGYYKDDLLYFVGRKDSQIKYKGYRIELLDVENNINQIHNVEKSVVTTISNNEIVKKIIAFVKLQERSKEKEENFLTELNSKLPNYMIPKIYFVDSFPTNLNGKIDLDLLKRRVYGH